MTNEMNTLLQQSVTAALPNAVIYARVSTQQQAKEGYSLQAQVDSCTNYAESNGYSVSKIFTDIGSARTLDRPNFKEMIKFCSKKENNVKAIITWRLDCITRKFDDFSSILEFAKRNKIKILTTDGYDLDNPESILMYRIALSLSSFEEEQYSQRIKLGLKHRAEQGYYPYTAPNGYKNSKDGLIIDNEKAKYIKKVFDLYNEGNPLNKTAKMLYKLGSSRKFTNAKIKQILSNLTYTGSFIYDGKVSKGNYQPIISKELFDSVQEKLKQEERENKMEKQKYTRITEKEAIELGYKGKFNSDRFVYYKVFRNNRWVVEVKKDTQRTITKNGLILG